jgi:2-polyprenyl-3-methyl-5-hydroxy-6-metoxy-1,4-benzoquinol methylase
MTEDKKDAKIAEDQIESLTKKPMNSLIDIFDLFEFHDGILKDFKDKYDRIKALGEIIRSDKFSKIFEIDSKLKDLDQLEKLSEDFTHQNLDELKNKIDSDVQSISEMKTRIPAESKSGLKKYQNTIIKRVEAQIIRQTEPIFSAIKEMDLSNLSITSNAIESIKEIEEFVDKFYVQYIALIDNTKESFDYIHYQIHDFYKFLDDKIYDFKDKLQDLKGALDSTANHLTVNIENIFHHLNTKSDLIKQLFEDLQNKFNTTNNYFTIKIEEIFTHLNAKADLNKQIIEQLKNDFDGTTNYFTKKLEELFEHLNTKSDILVQNLEDLENRQKLTANHFTKKLEEIFEHLNTKSDILKQDIEKAKYDGKTNSDLLLQKIERIGYDSKTNSDLLLQKVERTEYDSKTRSDLLLQRIEKIENDFKSVRDIAGELYNEAVQRANELFRLNDMRQESVELRQQEILEWMNNLDKTIDLHKKLLDKLARDRSSLNQKLDKVDEAIHTQTLLKKKIEQIEKSGFKSQKHSKKNHEGKEAEIRDLPSLEDHDYFLFEERFRGKSDDIKERQLKYIAFFESDGPVLDIGCGRGEFLELLKEKGIESYGIDVNPAMVNICQDKGLTALKADLCEHLDTLSDNSLGGIFMAQVIEHIPPQKIVELLKLSQSKLKPDGKMIIETINPLSIYALVDFYFKDLYHVQPIHPQTLSYLLEMAGFRNIDLKFNSKAQNDKLFSKVPDTNTYPDGVRNYLEIINSNFTKLDDLMFGYMDFYAVGVK